MITYGTGTYAGVMVVITGDISDVPTAIENAAAVLAAAQSTPIYSEIRRVNGVAVDGTGTDLDPWGPVG